MPLGSKQIDSSGYVRVKVVVGKGRWLPEHVLVMSRIVGRVLQRGEIVHHINGVRDDNRESNLYLCRDHAHHMDIERSLSTAFRRLLDVGYARFNHDTGEYEAILRTT